jgi:hypothetical protein
MADITITEGNWLSLTEVVVNNFGDVAGNQSLELDRNGTTEDAVTVDLQPNESTTRQLLWKTESGDAGTYTICAETDDGQDCIQVEVTQ